MVAVVLLGNGLIPPKWRGGACLMAGVCPGPENSPDPLWEPVNPGGGLTLGPGQAGPRKMLSLSGRAGEPRGPARVGPNTGPHVGAGESRGWPNSREGGLGPGKCSICQFGPVSRGGPQGWPHFPEINTRKGNAHLVRQGRGAEGLLNPGTHQEVLEQTSWLKSLSQN